MFGKIRSLFCFHSNANIIEWWEENGVIYANMKCQKCGKEFQNIFKYSR